MSNACPSVQELRERYSKLYSGLVYDLLDQMGYPNQALANDIKPLKPEWVIAGPAYTVRGSKDPSPDSIEIREIRFRGLELMEPGCVEVRDCGNDENVAHFGELNATLIRTRGAVGAVIDGGTRDSRHILAMDFPVFARYRNPVEAATRWYVKEVQVPIYVRGALAREVLVNPGDYIFGDMDGVVVIPKHLTLEVLERAEEIMRVENTVREKFLSGENPWEVYKRYRRL